MTGKCLWCQKDISIKLNITQLFSFRALPQVEYCEECKQQFQRISAGSSCFGCCRPIEKQGWCKDCKQWLQLYPELSLHHTALFSYNSFAKEWMQRFKFLGDTRVVRMIVPEIQAALHSFEEECLIIPIPISLNSFNERGFNQVEVLLKTARVSYQPLLINRSGAKKQSKKTYQERMDATQPFDWIEETIPAQEIKGQNVLLVDDVYTTGRTIIHAVKKVNEAKPKKISTFSIFR